MIQVKIQKTSFCIIEWCEDAQQSTVGAPSTSALAQMLSGMAQGQQQGPTLQQKAKLGAALLSSAFGMAPNTVQGKPKGPSLAQVLRPEVLVKYVKQPGMLQSLAEHLPESQR